MDHTNTGTPLRIPGQPGTGTIYLCHNSSQLFYFYNFHSTIAAMSARGITINTGTRVLQLHGTRKGPRWAGMGILRSQEDGVWQLSAAVAGRAMGQQLRQ
eukprot:3341902-Rhodomonas_salina.3